MGCSSMVRAGALYAQGYQFNSDHPDNEEKFNTSLHMKYVEIGVRVNTVVCGATDMGSNPVSQPNGQVADVVYAFR